MRHLTLSTQGYLFYGRIQTAKAADQSVKIEPARCRSCGYTFGTDKLTKPSKCPDCKGTRLYEPLVQIKL